MRYISPIIILCVFIFSSPCYAATSDSTCTIKGHIRGLGHHRIIFSYYYGADTKYHSDTVRASHGNFIFTTHLPEPEAVYIATLSEHPSHKSHRVGPCVPYIGKYGRRYPAIGDALLENRTMTWNASLKSIGRPSIDNAPINDSLNEIKKTYNAFYRQDSAWQHFWRKTTFPLSDHLSAEKKQERDSIRAHVRVKQDQYIAAYIRSHPSSYAAANSLWRLLSSDRTDRSVKLAAYNALDTSLHHLVNVSSYKKKLDMAGVNLVKGDTIPDVVLQDTSGSNVALSSVRGKVTVIDFWSSYSWLSSKEHKTDAALYRKYHRKGLEICSISTDSKKTEWTNAIRKDKLNWPQLSELNNLSYEKYEKYFGISVYPGNIILDQNGKVVAKNLRGDDLKQVVSGLMK